MSHVSGGPFSDKTNSLSPPGRLDGRSYETVFIHFSSVLIRPARPGSGGHFSGIHSQTRPLFTRGIIQRMATACLWCRIAHKERFRCLLGEMVTN